MGSDALYNEQALLWAVIRFVCAVTGMRRPPRPPYWRGAAWVQAQPAGLSPLSSALAASAACGRTSPLLCAAIWRRSFLWEVGTSYNERRLLWEVGTLCLSCNLRKDSPAPAALARRGRACGFNPPTCAACEVPMGSDASYNERRLLWEAVRSIGRRLLWEAVRLVQAVTCVRTAPRPVGANCVQAQPARIRGVRSPYGE